MLNRLMKERRDPLSRMTWLMCQTVLKHVLFMKAKRSTLKMEYFVKEWTNPLLFMTTIMNQWWWKRRTWTSKFQDYHIPLWNTREVPAFWRAIFESGKKMPETGFIPWGAVFESGKKYRKLVAQSLLSIFIHFLNFYCKYSTIQHTYSTHHTQYTTTHSIQDPQYISTAHHITWHHLTSHGTTWHHITPHYTTSQHITTAQTRHFVVWKQWSRCWVVDGQVQSGCVSGCTRWWSFGSPHLPWPSPMLWFRWWRRLQESPTRREWSPKHGWRSWSWVVVRVWWMCGFLQEETETKTKTCSCFCSLVPPRCTEARSSAFWRCCSGSSGTASGWRCAASTGWRRGSSRYWCPTRSLLRRGQASLCDICQHKTRLVELSPRVGMRTGKSDVYQQPIAGLSPESSWVKEDPLVEGTVCLFLWHTPITSRPVAEAADGGAGGAAQEEEGWRRRALWISQDSHIDFVLCVVFFVLPC